MVCSSSLFLRLSVSSSRFFTLLDFFSRLDLRPEISSRRDFAAWSCSLSMTDSNPAISLWRDAMTCSCFVTLSFSDAISSFRSRNVSSNSCLALSLSFRSDSICLASRCSLASLVAIASSRSCLSSSSTLDERGRTAATEEDVAATACFASRSSFSSADLLRWRFSSCSRISNSSISSPSNEFIERLVKDCASRSCASRSATRSASA
mmetsp:Transcript_13331/g.38032  ORF Transcript_13331/g.38032 Transcript_13331/m.38032 type:complete len:207 (+) Transcript_13331:1634-2254(+)